MVPATDKQFMEFGVEGMPSPPTALLDLGVLMLQFMVSWSVGGLFSKLFFWFLWDEFFLISWSDWFMLKSL